MSVRFSANPPRSYSFPDPKLRRVGEAIAEVNAAKTVKQANTATAKGVFHWVGYGFKLIGKGLLPACIRP